jgi:hypothetical protein
MPQNWTKHIEEGELKIENFSGGMDNSTPASMLPDDRCVLIENMYYDYSSGRIRTRWPFRRYSNSALVSSPVNGLYHWNNEFYFAADRKLYYLDSNLDPVLLGTIGNEPPNFLPFNGKLLVASGRTPQYVDTSHTLNDITGTGVPTTLKCLLEQNTSVFGCGNSDYPDRVHQSAVQDETTWSGTGTAYYDLGFKDDDLEVIGITHGPYGYIIAWKKGRSKKATWFLDPNESSPVGRLVSSNESAHTHRGAVRAANMLWIMDTFSPMAILGTDATEKLIIDPNSLKIGARIAKSWILDDNAFCVSFPTHGQIWFFPRPYDGNIWILHYLIGAWTKFVPAGILRFYSAFYLPSTKELYLGGNDGYIYKYDISGSGNYEDNPDGTNTDYRQRIITKVYNLFPRHRHELKSPILTYRGLKDGSGYFRIYQDHGADMILESTVTYSSSYPTLYDYQDKTLYEARNELLWVSQMRTPLFDKNIEANNFQIWLEITTGAIEFQDITLNIAKQMKI